MGVRSRSERSTRSKGLDLYDPKITSMGREVHAECTAREILNAERVLKTRLRKLIGMLYLKLRRARWYKWSCISSYMLLLL